ncbi:MAG TPA: TetR/AcrR family transcriptional regulator [Solirubrobacteraceae bacterium]|jgi:AcrR family transcriptional regulator
MAEPAYTRLQVDERRRQLIDAGSTLFAEYSFEEISMRQIAEAAGVSKALLYHYFPNKIELFKAAIQEHAGDLQRITEPSGQGTPIDQLSESLDGYLAWIERNAVTWAKLVQSATALPEAREVVQSFRAATLQNIVVRLTGTRSPPPALRTTLQGWLGYIDAAILDWVDNRDLTREQLRDLLVAAFAAALLAAQQADPKVRLDVA